jgi:hypothetical protein
MFILKVNFLKLDFLFWFIIGRSFVLEIVCLVKTSTDRFFQPSYPLLQHLSHPDQI